jgi:tRNA (cmo5U34)-methyltransferase
MEIKTLFNQAAQIYDQTRRRYIPCFDQFYGTVLELIPHPNDAEMRILDLGAGTGLLTALLAGAWPHAHFTLVDISEEMLARARTRFADEPERFTYQVLDYVVEPLVGEYDVVVSALSLHHTAWTELPKVFAGVYAVLRPGGIFINADQVLGATPANEALYETHWQRRIRALGCTEEEVALAVARMKADRTAPFAHQLNWLTAAGFTNVECWFKEYRFAVYSGTKV